MGDTELQQLAKTDRNPSQETRYQQLLKEQGPGGLTGGSPADQFIAQVKEEEARRAADFEKKYKEFDAANPFNFDEILAKESASAGQRLDPYYKQTLNDFLTGINVRRQRGMEDERTLLTDLQADTDRYEGDNALALVDTLEKTRQGFADAGLYFSGNRQRAEGRVIGESQRNLSDFLQGQDRAGQQYKTANQREQEDLSLEQQTQKRELGYFDENGNFVRGATPTYQVKSEALSAANQAQTLNQYQKQQVVGAPPGVDPTIFNLNTDQLLKNTVGA